jgi:hypothetical protein
MGLSSQVQMKWRGAVVIYSSLLKDRGALEERDKLNGKKVITGIFVSLSVAHAASEQRSKIDRDGFQMNTFRPLQSSNIQFQQTQRIWRATSSNMKFCHLNLP